MASWFRRGDLPESPPPDFAKRGPGPGYTIQYFDSLDALGDFARENNIDGHDSYNAQRFMGGVVPSKKIIALPKPGLLRDDELDKALYQHEVGGHSNGLVHDDTGHNWGWNGPDGQFHPVATSADLAAAQAKYPEPTSFDWSKAFAKAPGDPAQQAVQVAKNLSQPQDPPANDDKPTTTASTGGAE